MDKVENSPKSETCKNETCKETCNRKTGVCFLDQDKKDENKDEKKSENRDLAQGCDILQQLLKSLPRPSKSCKKHEEDCSAEEDEEDEEDDEEDEDEHLEILRTLVKSHRELCGIFMDLLEKRN